LTNGGAAILPKGAIFFRQSQGAQLKSSLTSHGVAARSENGKGILWKVRRVGAQGTIDVAFWFWLDLGGVSA
jgi:hypothetical protein